MMGISLMHRNNKDFMLTLTSIIIIIRMSYISLTDI